MVEEWRDIEGYEGYYQISNLGRVKSVARVIRKSNSIQQKRSGVILRQTTHRQGYKLIILSNIKQKSFLVHRLVAIAFIPNPDNKLEINHIDEVKDNNHVSNLEWCDAQYNSEYSKAKSYKFISPNGDIVEFFNMSKFCRENSLCHSNMIAVANGKQNSCMGWRVKPLELKYKFISPDGNIHKTASVRALSRKFGLKNSAMSKVHRGLNSHHKGWRKYNELSNN